MRQCFFILYVRDQAAAKRFYSLTLDSDPTVDVPGITEYALCENAILALMPESGINRLLGDSLPEPVQPCGFPRAEVYLVVDDPTSYHRRALEAGATEIRPIEKMDWGHEVAYSLDPDCHVLAFAKVVNEDTIHQAE